MLYSALVVILLYVTAPYKLSDYYYYYYAKMESSSYGIRGMWVLFIDSLTSVRRRIWGKVTVLIQASSNDPFQI